MNKNEIRNLLLHEYPYRIELHAHTSPASSCGRVPADKLVENYKKAGYDAVTITNHFSTHVLVDYYKAANKRESMEKHLADYRLAKQTGDRLGLKVYLGAELRFDQINDNDYLLFGIDEDLLCDAYDYIGADPETFIRKGKNEKSVLIQAHPFRDHMTQLEPRLLDGLEVFNMHPSHNSRIAFAERFANENGVTLKTIGTDYHYADYENLCATRTRTLPADSFALAALLKSGDFIGEIGDTLILS